MAAASPFFESAPNAGRPPLLLGSASIWHRRLRPAAHAFRYPGFFLLLPMRAWRDGSAAHARLSRNRFGPMSFYDRDHGTGQGDALQWFEQILQAEGVGEADGEIWLQTFPRLWGFVFNPVSFWYALRRDGSLAAIAAEVNNTFGERHCYLLAGANLQWNVPLAARKVFHVSPFCPVAGCYTFRFRARPWKPGRRAGTLLAQVDFDDGEGPLLRTAIAGRLVPLTRGAHWRLLATMPLMTLGVVWRIHWQALRLFLKRVPFFSKPSLPNRFVTR